MDDLSPESMPFDTALKSISISHHYMRGALIDAGDSVDMAKRILLQHRVRNFSAEDVVRLAIAIMEREQVLAQRGRE